MYPPNLTEQDYEHFNLPEKGEAAILCDGRYMDPNEFAEWMYSHVPHARITIDEEGVTAIMESN